MPWAVHKLATFYGLEAKPTEIARLTESQALCVATFGRRSLEAVAAWLEPRGLEFGVGPPVDRPEGRAWGEMPWLDPAEARRRRRKRRAHELRELRRSGRLRGRPPRSTL